MPGGADDKPKKRAPTFGSDDERRFARRTPTAGTPFASPVEVSDEVTGRYQGEQLAKMRAARDERERIAILEVKGDEREHEIRALEANLKTTDKLVDHLNTRHEYAVKPLIEKLPGQLDLVRAAQVNLNAAMDAAITSSERSAAEMSRQLQDHAVRIGAVERKGDAHESEIAALKKQHAETAGLAARNRADVVALKKGVRATTSTDAKVGSWVRRHAGKALLAVAAAIGAAIAGVVGGYLSSKLGVGP